ncbi:Lrp/AsnC ligand binding domain-containing protein [Nocardioides convexus]|uniref:Lrp/AsnC ligand binding domain-containing protein n=1 Tax=Nocardioides convexus TaxID=2712224 RepID=UPI002418515A|nr:Lrp/AsnC ligand binding domain-containing protein [Nocardioides convexus]
MLEFVAGVPEVEEVLTLAGDPDALVRLRVEGVEDLRRVVELAPVGWGGGQHQDARRTGGVDAVRVRPQTVTRAILARVKYPRRVSTRDEENERAFAALGRYVYEFSSLCQSMQRAIISLSDLVGPAFEVSRLLMGEITARPLANVCFAVLERAVEGSSDSEKLVKALKSRSSTRLSAETILCTATG